MKRDARTGRYMTTGRMTNNQSGGSFDRIRSKSGEIVAVNTRRVSAALGRSRHEVVVKGRDGRTKDHDSCRYEPRPRGGRKS
jgi:hypothetical protein